MKTKKEIRSKYVYVLQAYTIAKYTDKLEKLYLRELMSADEYSSYLDIRYGELMVLSEILDRDLYHDMYRARQWQKRAQERRAKQNEKA